MKHILITGSTRGIGFHLAGSFLDQDCHVTINGTSNKGIEKAINSLKSTCESFKVQGFSADVTKLKDVKKLCKEAVEGFGKVDIWINNAGIDQSGLLFNEMDADEYERILSINILGTFHGSQVAINHFKKTGGGSVYNMAGFGSNGQTMKRMGVYGTSKRAVQYFTKTLMKEMKGSGVQVGLISPGMVMTDMIYNRIGEYPDGASARKIFNILADTPKRVCPWIVGKILANTSGHKYIQWLTQTKVMWRFMISGFNRRDFFKTSD